MIKIVVEYQQELIQKILISGHAGYEESGKDIVCAGISAISQGGINALQKYVPNTFTYRLEQSGLIEIKVVGHNEKTQLILNTMLVQLESIYISYRNYVDIERR